MSVEIRRGTIHDIDAIAEIIKLTFDDVVDKERVKQLLTLSHDYVYVAVQSGVVVGFVENFITVSQDNRLRLELDLLAVHPNARGHGIGKKLIEVSINKARELGVYCLRALIASENEVMQRACKRMNLAQSQNEFGLYVKLPQRVSVPIVETLTAHLICVETLTYRGIWLEGEITEATLDNAQLIVIQNQLDIIGAVVTQSNRQVIELLSKRQFTHMGNYHRWVLNL